MSHLLPPLELCRFDPNLLLAVLVDSMSRLLVPLQLGSIDLDCLLSSTTTSLLLVPLQLGGLDLADLLLAVLVDAAVQLSAAHLHQFSDGVLLRLWRQLSLPAQKADDEVGACEGDGVAGRRGQLVHEVGQGKVPQPPSTERADHRLAETPSLQPRHNVDATASTNTDPCIIKNEHYILLK